MIAGIAAASCGRQGEPEPFVEADPTGTAVSVKLPRDPEEAAGYVADFGYVLVGARGAVVTEVWNGGREEIVIERAAVGSPFDTDLPDSFSLTPGEATVVELGFEPAEEGAASAELVLTARAGGGSTEIRIRLGGQGIAPYLACDPAELHFGEVLVGSAKELGFRCTNELGVPISVVVQAADEGAILALDVTPSAGAGEPIVLMPRGLLEGRVTYRPSEAGRLVGSLTLREPGGSALATIGIQAIGVEDEPPGDECIEFTPPRIVIPMCASSTVMNVVVRSNCEGTTIDAVEIMPGPHAHAFQVAARPQLPLTLSIGDVAKIGLLFTPADGDPRDLAAELGLWSGSDTFTLPLTGIAIEEHEETFVMEDPIDLRLPLAASPADTNGDGAVDELDFHLFVDGRLIVPSLGIDEWQWSYDPDGNAIDLRFVVPPEPGTEVTVRFTVPCSRD